MTQIINAVKLKAAAEHLEWVLNQYPNEPAVYNMLIGLLPLIEDAKAGKILVPVTDEQNIPFRWAVSAEGLYRDYKDPNIERAYVTFAIEMEGGLTEADKHRLARIEEIQKSVRTGGRHE
jgi:hypothetical protein